MIDYNSIKDTVEHEPIHKFNSGQIQSLNNLMVNFDKEVIPYIANDDDLENYEEIIDAIIDMQNEFIDMYYKLYPPFRHAVDDLNDKLAKELREENKKGK